MTFLCPPCPLKHHGHSVALYIASLAEVGQGRLLTRVEVAAIAWGVNILSGIINTFGTKGVGRMSAFNVWWTLGGTFVLAVTLLVKAPVKVENFSLTR
jgi:amino acid transporter